MGSRARRLGLSALTAAVAALAICAPAQGSTVKAECEFIAQAKVTDKEDPALGMRLQGGTGNFTFGSLALNCFSVEKGVPHIRELAATATGYYHTVVCGTVKLAGILEVPTSNPLGFVLDGKKFALEFLGSAGVFYWHDWDKPTVGDTTVLPDPKEEIPKDWAAAGAIQMFPPLGEPGGPSPKPDPPNVAAGECTKAFTAYGWITVDE